MEFLESLMKWVVMVQDVVALVKRFETAPRASLREMGEQMRQGAQEVLERVMNDEIALFLGQEAEKTPKRNGYATRTFVFKGP